MSADRARRGADGRRAARATEGPEEDRRAAGPLLVVSNRLPITLQRTQRGLERRRSAGGLVSALEPALSRRGGTWVGWPGAPVEAGESISSQGDPYRLVPVHLSSTEVNRYYHAFSNRTLWPLFHCFPERMGFETRNWKTYDAVNERFADVVAAQAGGHDLIWIHDYHLMTTPAHLRRKLPHARTAFFLHIPFPPYDIFRLLPRSRELLSGVLAADLVGFHVAAYAQNFLECVEHGLGARVDLQRGLVEYADRSVRVAAFPIGIDFDLFEQRARSQPATAQDRAPEARAEKIVLGVDRLDYTKGIPERIRAFAHLLELHPEHRENVVLLQIAVPSRNQVTEYQSLKREIDELVGRVNGRFATATWSPIRYLYRSLPQPRLSALYRDADVALVTPIRDGMNLVAKEFIASQTDRPGVLVLSRFAGAAETMREAIHVNPLDADQMAQALHRALVMEEPERRSRLVALRRRERIYDVHRWLRDFQNAARAAGPPIDPASDSDFEGWVGRFLQRHQLALFLDYDGTLAEIARHPSEATLSPAMRAAIQACARRDDTDVTIVSGRALSSIRDLVALPDVVYAGNHGLEISGPGVGEFRHDDLHHFRDRLKDLGNQLEQLCVPGAWVEEKGASLTVHFREADQSAHAAFAERVRSEINDGGFQARDAHCAVEARPPIGWDKGHAVLHILRARYGPAWSESVRTVYAGDDETDEDAFRVLSGLGVTFRVGGWDHPTGATRTLPNVEAVGALLQWISRRI